MPAVASLSAAFRQDHAVNGGGLAVHPHCAAIAPGCRRSVEASAGPHRHGGGIGVADGDQAATGQAAGLNHPVDIDHPAQNGAGRRRRHQHPAAANLNNAANPDQRLHHRWPQLHPHQRPLGEGQHRRLARGQDHSPQPRLHQAVAGQAPPQKSRIPALGSPDGAMIDHLTEPAVALEGHGSGQEIAIPDVQGRGHQTADIHGRPLAEHDAVGVDQHHLAVGRQPAADQRGVGGCDPVQDHGRGIGLKKGYRPLGPDIEALPLKDRLGAGLGNGHGAAGFGDQSLTGGDHAAAGQLRRFAGQRRQAGGQGRQRGAGQQRRTEAVAARMEGNGGAWRHGGLLDVSCRSISKK